MSANKGSGFSNGEFKQKDKKSALEQMMQECTNRIAKEKYQPQSFQHRTTVGKVPFDSHHHGVHMMPSGSANSNFGAMPSKNLKPTGLPPWCCTEMVPALYRHIENYTTSNGAHEIANNLLLPVLLSSGLTREVLGLIWEMTNKTHLGVLTREELYATLAVVALYQAGYPVQTLDPLHLLPCPPVPVLRFPLLAPQGGPDVMATAMPPIAQSPPLTVAPQQPYNQPNMVVQPPQVPSMEPPITFAAHLPTDAQAGLSGGPRLNLVHPDVRTNSVSMASSIQQLPIHDRGPNVLNYQNGIAAKQTNSIYNTTNASEDDFADFQSSAPAQINQSNSDDFDDFKQADMTSSFPTNTIETSYQPTTTLQQQQQHQQPQFLPSQSKIPPLAESSLKSNNMVVFPPINQTSVNNFAQFNGTVKPAVNNATEDKYAVFKTLEVTSEPDPPIATIEPEPVAQFQTIPQVPNEVGDVKEHADEFGDFLCADVTTPTVSQSSDSPLEFIGQTTNRSSDESFHNYPQTNNHLNLGNGLKSTFSDKGSVNSLESPVYLYESDNLDALSISSFHHSPSRSRKVYAEDDISFDKISMGPAGGDGSNDHSATFSTSSHESSSTETGEQVNFDSTSVNTFPIADRYSYIRSQTPVCLDKVATDWIRCLEKCRDILDEARSTFYFACNELSQESLEELFETDEIGDYLENVTEVFCIVRRIYASSLASGRYLGNIQAALNENDLIWEELAGGISSFYKLPEKIKLDFSSAVLSPTTESLCKSCGVCLLDVDANCGIFGEDECGKLTYGGRQYHSSCANVWVNCVDLLLPALQNAELL